MRAKQRQIFKILLIMVLDMVAVSAAGLLALLAAADFMPSRIPPEALLLWRDFLPMQLAVTIAVFWLCKMYHYIWRAVNMQDVVKMAVAVILAYGLCDGLAYWRQMELPLGVQAMSFLCQLCALVGMRCGLRMYQVVLHPRQLYVRPTDGPRMMLVGAGEAGWILLREIEESGHVKGNVCCIIDDNPQKWGKYVGGIPIVGGREEIEAVAMREKIDQILFAIPTASAENKRDILSRCNATGCKVSVLPGVYQLVNGEVSMAAMKDIQVEDLLGREPVKLDLEALHGFLGGKVVMVTGGGGSIGSELCRQIARYDPKQLIILDIYENNAYDIQQELVRTYGDSLNLRVEIASVRDKAKIDELFRRLRPDIVFHAAAHKHVPLMESCPEEAIKNNVFGTYHVVRASEKYGVKKFIMISTDKAVNPTNFMGATKRFCEKILQSRLESQTEFAAVRFGNVLGSNGSVVPLFKRQIMEGGPVTITDKRIIRYFMTIPEAASLVLEAGSMAKRRQIFVLDMGEPVKILTLAENLIKLSGLRPYEDIDIQEIGLRPGEKLYEELLMKSSDLSKTSNQKIYVEQQCQLSPEEITDGLLCLDKAITAKLPPQRLVELMMQLVPTYHHPDEVNMKTAEKLTQELEESLHADELDETSLDLQEA